MYPRYYGLRRVNPYRGVMQVVDVGDGLAHSFDGQTWHLRADDGYGLVRPVGVWEAGVGLKLGQADVARDLLDALETMPALPFPIFDVWECWLLDKQSGQPLALLNTARDGPPRQVEKDASWHPFVLTYSAFVSSSLTRAGIAAEGTLHRDKLARMVNDCARPNPMAQWFKRGQSGVGQGDTESNSGTRLPYEWRTRTLPNSSFPTLLVHDFDNSRLEQSVIADYHAWLAPILLQWPRLDDATRNHLEEQACNNPTWLARVHRLLPKVRDQARVNAALVAARLLAAQGITHEIWIEN